MLDRYLRGRVERISPEAPVPVIRLDAAEENRLGGAANVAVNLRSLGAHVDLACLVGEDAHATLLGELLATCGCAPEYVIRDASRQTTVKTRLIAQHQQLLRADREDTHDVAGAAAGGLRGAIERGAGKADLVLLQDYNKGTLSPDIIAHAVATARAAGLPTAVDPKAANFWAYRGATLFKPNLREMQQQVDFALNPRQPATLDRAAELLFDRMDVAQVMITLSSYGIYVHDRDRSAIYPTAARQVADVSGAGDTVISVAACALARGWALGDIARLANLAGAQVIAKAGVVAVDVHELAAAWKPS